MNEQIDLPQSASDGDQSRDFVITAHRLTSDLVRPRPLLYWMDLLLSSALGYAALAAAILSTSWAVKSAFGAVAILALYRAVLFIHELSHLRRGAIPGFRTAWNVLVGIPVLMPSFFGEGAHNHHHARSTYGTLNDPEYFVFGERPEYAIILSILRAPLVPLLALARFGVLTPLSAFIPAVRRMTIERFSSLAINLRFRRPPPRPDERTYWLSLEVASMLWAWIFLVLALRSDRAMSLIGTTLLVLGGVALINQLRTIISHRWENDGRRCTALEQVLDSVSVPPPALLPMLWAPVGLRYHSLHHMLPNIPYHNLGVAHRRLIARLPEASPYRRTITSGFRPAITRFLEWSSARRNNAAAA